MASFSGLLTGNNATPAPAGKPGGFNGLLTGTPATSNYDPNFKPAPPKPTPPPKPGLLGKISNVLFHNPIDHAVGNFGKNLAVSTGKAAVLTGQGVVNLENIGISKATGTKYVPVQKQTPLLQKLSGSGPNPALHQYLGAALQTGALALGPEGKLLTAGAGKVAGRFGESIASKATSKGLGAAVTRAGVKGVQLAPSGAAFGGGAGVSAGDKGMKLAKDIGVGAAGAVALGGAGSLLGSLAKAKTGGIVPPKAEIPMGKTSKTPLNPTLPKVQIPDTIPSEGKFKNLISVSGELSRQGASGKEIATRLGKAESSSETGQAGFISKIPTVTKLKSNEFPQFVKTLGVLEKAGPKQEQTILDGLSPKMSRAVREWSDNIGSVRDRATAAGIKVGDLGKYYFPRNYTDLLSSKDGLSRAAQHLVDTKQAANLGDAIGQLNLMKSKYTSPFGHFEQSRKLDLPNYDQSKNAALNYVSGAFNKIGHAEQFGAKGEVADRLIGNIAAEGRNAERALKNYQLATGTFKYHNPGVAKAAGKVRTFQRVTKLGLSSILNATQSTNTAAETGIFRTAKAAFKQMSKDDRAYVDKTGVVIDSVINNLREQAGAAAKTKSALGKVFNAPGFGAVEKFNRGVAAVAGRDWANKLASKGDTKSLAILKDKLGVEGNIGKKLTEQQQIQAGRKVVELTQFKTGAKDLPGWADSPMGKVVAQFRTFSYKQTGFIYNELIKQALHGNAMPLARFIAVGVPLGIGAGGVRNELRGKPFYGTTKGQSSSQKLLGATYQGSSNVGGTGLAGAGIFLAQNAKSPNIASYVAGDVGGPTVGLAASVVQAGTNKTKLERLGLNQVPVAGPALATKLTPFGSAQQRSFESVAGEKTAKALVQAKYSPADPSDERSKTLKTSNPKQYQQFLDSSNKSFAQKVDHYLSSGDYKTDSPDTRKRTLSQALSQARQKTLDNMGIKKPPKTKTPKAKSY